MKISIIIPAYNEEKRIERTLEAYLDFFDSLVKRGILDYEIIVVINNTTDKTEEIVARVKKRNSRLRYLNLRPGGKGFAITQGFRQALRGNSNLIGFVDADLATAPSAFYALIMAMRSCQGAIANRYDSRSSLTPRMTFRRIIVAKIFNLLVRALFSIPYPDTQCGAKIFTRKLIESVLPKITLTQWAYDIDLLYLSKREGFHICSVPTQWTDMEGSKIKLVRSSLEMFFAVVQLRLLHSPVRRFSIPLRSLVGELYRFLLQRK